MVLEFAQNEPSPITGEGIHPRNRPLLFEILTLEIATSARYSL
jgi:hypothetical protein